MPSKTILWFLEKNYKIYKVYFIIYFSAKKETPAPQISSAGANSLTGIIPLL